MPNRTEEDFWVEMSIREIWTQCHFAERAFANLDPKASVNNDIVFSWIHSFLSHCALVSKLLKATGDSVNIGSVLWVSYDSTIHNRKFRNHLEHYDERLKKWIRKKGKNGNIGTYNIGPKGAFNIPNMIFVSHYDPDTSTFTFVDEDLALDGLHEEIRAIKTKAETWVEGLNIKAMKPPNV